MNVRASKVKNLLTGLPLTATELASVAQDPTALPALIDQWMATPEWQGKMIGFFRQAFQQTQTDINDYDEQLGRTTNPWNNQDKIRFVRAAEDSFALTVMELIKEGRPFSEVLTTDRFMLNAPLMSSYAYMDAVPVNDNARPIVTAAWLLQKFKGLTFSRTTNPDPVTGVPVPIPLEDSINPASPNFMKWYEPRPYMGANGNCKEGMSARTGVQALASVADFLYGGRPGCGSSDSHFSAADWNAWRMVTIRKPKNGAEERTTFWDLPKLRDPATADLVLNTPRVGFMTTPAFFANWPTNASNSYRVTTNQALIVGLGRSFDDRGITVSVNETSVDNLHVQPGTTCYGCHQMLDPMRDFFKQTYSLSYFQQLGDLTNPRDPVPATAVFAVDGSPPVQGTGISALTRAMADHPSFATAWTQKLCQFANSSSCNPGDPEFQRVAQVFRASNFNFKTLVRELFSSPLVTFASDTLTARTHGIVISIARQAALCGALENRFKVPDVCSLRSEGGGRTRVTIRNLALSIPGDGYGRGDETPLMPHDPSLFFHSATENLCGIVAAQLADAGANSRYTSGKKDDAIKDFVATVMALPAGDDRAPVMTAILNEHHAAALAAGATATNALRSTFILACASPLGISLGL